MNYKFCQHCGRKIPKDSTFCNYCGAKQESVHGSSESNIDPNVALKDLMNDINNSNFGSSSNSSSYNEDSELNREFDINSNQYSQNTYNNQNANNRYDYGFNRNDFKNADNYRHYRDTGESRIPPRVEPDVPLIDKIKEHPGHWYLGCGISILVIFFIICGIAGSSGDDPKRSKLKVSGKDNGSREFYTNTDNNGNATATVKAPKKARINLNPETHSGAKYKISKNGTNDKISVKMPSHLDYFEVDAHSHKKHYANSKKYEVIFQNNSSAYKQYAKVKEAKDKVAHTKYDLTHKLPKQISEKDYKEEYTDEKDPVTAGIDSDTLHIEIYDKMYGGDKYDCGYISDALIELQKYNLDKFKKVRISLGTEGKYPTGTSAGVIPVDLYEFNASDIKGFDVDNMSRSDLHQMATKQESVSPKDVNG